MSLDLDNGFESTMQGTASPDSLVQTALVEGGCEIGRVRPSLRRKQFQLLKHPHHCN
jgi:hypothetical protein